MSDLANPQGQLRRLVRVVFSGASHPLSFSDQCQELIENNWEIHLETFRVASNGALYAMASKVVQRADDKHRCTICRIVYVDSEHGFDTCVDCLREVRVR